MSGEDKMTGFECFMHDMGARPTPAHTIERIRVDGPYSPENCVWLPRKFQNRNKQNSRFVEWNGSKVLLLDLTKQGAVGYKTAIERLDRGWSVKDAVFLPPKKVWWGYAIKGSNRK